MNRWFWPVVACATLIGTLAAPVRAADDGPRCKIRKYEVPEGTWTEIEAKRFPIAPLLPLSTSYGLPVISYAIDPGDPERVLLASDETIALSTDSGCTARIVLSLQELAAENPMLSPYLAKIEHVYMERKGSQRSAYALILSDTYPEPRTFLATSSDGGSTWETRATPDAIQGISRLIVAPGHPEVLYTVAPLCCSPKRLYRSGDGGLTWELRSVNIGTAATSYPPYDETETEGRCIDGEEGPCNGVDFSPLAVDPLDPDVLWTAGSFGLYRSIDGGAKWFRLADIDSSTTGGALAVDVFGAPRRPTRIAVVGQWGFVWSGDSGRSWTKHELPEATHEEDTSEVLYSVAHGDTSTELVGTMGWWGASPKFAGSVFRFTGRAWVEITPPGYEPPEPKGAVCHASSDRTRDPAFYFIAGPNCWGSHLLKFEPN